MLGLIDESAPSSPRGVHYVIGAAILLDADARDDVRARVSKLVEPRLRPFHWKDEGIEKRVAMIELLSELDVGVFASIHHPVPPRRQTEARHVSLDELVPLLCREGVDELLIESRGSQDNRDRSTLIAAIQAGRVPSGLMYGFASKEDPLLWLPDAVAGVLSEAECRKADQWVAELQRVVPVFEVHRHDRPLDALEPRLLS